MPTDPRRARTQRRPTTAPAHPPGDAGHCRCRAWQVAYWLRDNQLARILGPNATMELTDQGRALAAELAEAAA